MLTCYDSILVIVNLFALLAPHGPLLFRLCGGLPVRVVDVHDHPAALVAVLHLCTQTNASTRAKHKCARLNCASGHAAAPDQHRLLLRGESGIVDLWGDPSGP